MSTDDTFALLLTWTSYGTWLPGDRRGYVSNTLNAQGGFLPKQNHPGTPYLADDAFTHHRAKTLQKWPTAQVAREDAFCAAHSFVDTASNRHWRILRGAIMSNHVHLVVMDCPDEGPAVRRIFKGTSQAALSRQHSCPKRWWTQGGSDRYLHGEEAIVAAIRYVEKQERMLVGIEDMKVYLPS